MLFTTKEAESLPFLTGTVTVMSSANFTRKLFFSLAAQMSFTISENSIGPNTVPRGIPLLMLK